jgi:hypothetical protein
MVLDYSTLDITKNNERVSGKFSLCETILTALIQCVKAPYLINIKKVSYDDALNIINSSFF